MTTTNKTATLVTLPTSIEQSNAGTFARIIDRALKAWAVEPQPSETAAPITCEFDLAFGDARIEVVVTCSSEATVLDIDAAMHDAWRRIAGVLRHEVVTWKSAR